MSKILSIHQPNYIPYLGFFYKIAKSDVFVYLDEVQFPRGQSFASRNKIKTPNGVVYLTIPISIPRGRKGKVKYSEVEFANDKWKDKHLKTLQFSYKRAKYFDEVFNIFRNQILAHNKFVELNIALIEKFLDYLAIPTKRVRLSKILDKFGKKTELIIDLCKTINAETYLSGTGGGREYNDEEMLLKNNIILKYSNFKHPEYSQLWGEFQSNLSIIDLLFNHGPESRSILYGC